MEQNINFENNVDNNNASSTLKMEKMRYQNNSISYWLGMLGILLSMFAAFVLLNSATPRAATLIKILMNIAILLFGFMACEKVKAYSKNYSYVMMGIGALCVVRMFWFPIQIITNYISWTDATKTKNTLETSISTLTNDLQNLINEKTALEANHEVVSQTLLDQITNVTNSLADATANPKLTEAISTIAKCEKYIAPALTTAGHNWLPQSGVFRGILAIILLGGAACAFIFSGLICYKKNKELTQYLASINVSSDLEHKEV